jgi:hypothetical protein
MSVKKFKFVSPGVFINEIDNSELPTVPAPEGPTIIGRSLRGPAMRPVEVESMEEFVTVFGPPINGSENVDAFRHPEFGAPTYGGYAAEAWLRNSSTINFVRLLGRQDENYTVGSGEAGWKLADFSATGGGAYGLYVFNSGSGGTHEGTLGAIFYCDDDTYVELSGTVEDAHGVGADSALTGACALVKTTNNEATVRIVGGLGTIETACGFDRTSRRYIRSTFNTNPTKTTTGITPTADRQDYFLGETFDRAIESVITGTSNIAFAMVVPLDKGSTGDGANFGKGFVDCQTGWVISQDKLGSTGSFNPTLAASVTKLFKFHGLQTGQYDQGAVKISIENIMPAKNPAGFGTFNVVVRRLRDNDAKVQEVERYNSLTLNPNSPNYVATQIGDRYISWDNDSRVYKEYGQYENRSRYFRVEMAQVVDDGALDNILLPYGYYGPQKYRNITLGSGSTLGAADFAVGTASLPDGANPNLGTGSGVDSRPYGGVGDWLLPYGATCSISMPSVPLRTSTATGDVSSPQAAYFGITTTRGSGSSTYDDSIPAFLRTKPVNIDSFAEGTLTQFSHVFTLDDLVVSNGNMTYSSGSRVGGTSLTAKSGSYSILTGTLSPKGFTMPLFGGFDGLDITEKDPFANRNTTGETERSSYAYHSLTVAMDSIRDREVVLTNVITAPAITTAGLTNKMLDIAEDRGDCLAVIDLAGGFQPSSENASALSARIGSVTNTVNNLNARNLNTSFGCAFYPWVSISDSFGDANLWVPPSVVALGAFSYTDKNADPWFAPAGFTRGGLSKGAGGVRVVGVTDRLRSKDRDDLYETNINPIGTFPNEGIVILGQKTLQTTRSALDRINVRRLLIYTKRQITAVANNLLFEQNVPETWKKFTGLAEPILRDIQAGFGLEDYRLILDETTTTPELRDRNIMYAKIFLKPAKSIEFIALDFIITNSAATFE